MSGAGVLNCVAALVAAFLEGQAIAQRIDAKRQASGSPLPPRSLEDSLVRGAKVVEEAKDNGVERFGPAFAKGDHVTASALRDIIIELQGCFIRELRAAFDDDTMMDFTVVVDASHAGRTKAVIVLNELYMRMASGATSQADYMGQSLPSTLDFGGRASSGATQVPQIQAQMTQSISSPGRVQTLPHNQSSELYHQQQQNTSTSDRVGQPKAMLPHQPWGSMSPIQQTVSETPTVNQTSSTNSSAKSRIKRFFSTPAARTPNVQVDSNSKKRLSEATTNSSDSGSTRHTGNSFSSNSRPSPPPTDALASLTLDQNPWAGAHSTSTQKPSKSTPFSRHHKSAPAVPRAASFKLTLAKSDSEFNGFCKGAYYHQHRLRSDALKLRNASGAFSGEGYYWGCSNSKCCFEGRARHIQGREWGLDETIRVRRPSVQGGPTLEFRWSFLAKSHVAEGRIRNGRYGFQCIFCVGRDPQEQEGVVREVFRGVGSFIEHVALEHREEDLGRLGMDRVVTAGDGFDVRFIGGGRQEGQEEGLTEPLEDDGGVGSRAELHGQEILEAAGDAATAPRDEHTPEELDSGETPSVPLEDREQGVSPWGTSYEEAEEPLNPWAK